MPRSEAPRRARWAIPNAIRHLATVLALSAIATATGCAVLTSEEDEVALREGRAPTGIAYSLPKSVIDLSLYVNFETAQFRVTASDPYSIADPSHRYYLRYQPLPQYEDKVDVAVTSNGLLKSISANTTDKTGEVILNLVRAVSAFGSAFESGPADEPETLILKTTIDPTDEGKLRDAERKLKRALRGAAEAAIGENCRDRKKTEKLKLGLTRLELCAAFNNIAANGAISVKFRPLSSSLATAPVKSADCGVGICYRPPLQHEILIEGGGGLRRGIMMMPNSSPLVAIEIRRGFFINKVQTLEFETDGSLKKMTVKKESELLAISKLPVEIVSAVAEGLKLRVEILDQQIGSAKSTGELLQAKADLEKQRVLFESALHQRQGPLNAAGSIRAVRKAPLSSAPLTTGSTSSFIDRNAERN